MNIRDIRAVDLCGANLTGAKYDDGTEWDYHDDDQTGAVHVAPKYW